MEILFIGWPICLSCHLLVKVVPMGCYLPCTFGLGYEALLGSYWENQSSVRPDLGDWNCCGFHHSEHDEGRAVVLLSPPVEGNPQKL